jgi:hypothetical protein
MAEDRHKHSGLSWHPPGELSAWARAEAKRRSVKLSALLTEALTEYRERQNGAHAEPKPRGTVTRKPAAKRARPEPGQLESASEMAAAIFRKAGQQ